MKITDRLSHILGSRTQATSEPEGHLLEPFEIRLIADGKLERLTDFAASSRLHTPDSKGDTPLHLAARLGNLALCDLFVRSGADPNSLNYEQQIPAEVALAEGHKFTAQLLYSLVINSHQPEGIALVGKSGIPEPILPPIQATPAHHLAPVQETKPNDPNDYLNDILSFEAEEEPTEFFGQHTGETASGTFVALVSSATAVFDDGDWDLDLSLVQIAGEGIGSSAAVAVDHGAESDFLKVRNRGRQSMVIPPVNKGLQK